MFYRFKPEKGFRPIKSDPTTDHLAGSIFSRLLRVQRRYADFLNEKFKRLPAGRLKILFLTVAITAGSYSLFLIASGFWGKPPESIFLREKTPLPPVDTISRRQKQQAFEAYLDSLEKAFIRDSINSIQP